MVMARTGTPSVRSGYKKDGNLRSVLNKQFDEHIFGMIVWNYDGGDNAKESA